MEKKWVVRWQAEVLPLKTNRKNPIRFVLLLVMVLISASSQSTFMKQLVHAVLNFSVINVAPPIKPQI